MSSPPPADDPADALGSQIETLFAEGRYAEAVPLARELLAMREAALGADHPDLANDINHTALALHESGELAGARALLERALAILDRSLGRDHPSTAMVLSNLARLLDDMGDSAEARTLFEQAIDSLTAALGAEHPEVALGMNNFGVLLHQQGEYDDALRQLEAARDIFHQARGADRDVAMVLGNLGRLREDLGDYAGARDDLQAALALFETAYGPRHPDVATSAASLASLLHEEGDFAGARPLYERALDILEHTVGPDDLDTADVLNDLGRLLHDQGDFGEAHPLYRRALEIREGVLGPDHTEVAASLDNLAVLLDDQDRFTEARPLYERAFEIRQGALGPGHPSVAGSLTNLAVLHFHLGDFDAARPLYERALAIWEAAVGPDHPDTAMALNNLATLHEEVGDFDAAGALYARAHAVWEAALGPGHPDVALCLRNLATLHWARGDREAARAFLLRAAGALDRHAAAVLPALAPAEQRAFVDVALSHLAGPLLSLADGPAALAETYAALAGWKGLLLDGLRRQSAIAGLAGDPRHADDVAALQASRARVAHAFHAGAEPDELAAHEAERERLERALARALPPDAADDWQGAEAPAGALPPGSAFVDVYQYVRWEAGKPAGWRYGAVVAAPGAPPALADLGPAGALDDAVEAWRSARDEESDASAGLAARVWGPVAAALPPGAARAWVAPDGALARVPWSVLAGIHAAGGGPLVTQVPSARALLRLLRSREEDAPGALLIVSDVEFGPVLDPWDSPGWDELPGTGTEGRAIAGVADAAGISVRRLEGDAATPAAVADAAQEAAYVHLATHGFFDGWSGAEYRARQAAAMRAGPGSAALPAGRSPLAASGLALAGSNEGPHGNLTAEEILGLRLGGVRLVVLSACDTGRGAEVTGQGVLGLQAAVQAAGARALLMSLWPVPDEATAALMEAFYHALWDDGLAPARALRRAQAAVRARPAWRAPVFWAGWSLVGDGFRPLA